MGKLINRIPGSSLLISSLPGSALKTHVESLGKPHNVNKRSQALPGKLDIKRHSPSISYICFQQRNISVYHARIQKIPSRGRGGLLTWFSFTNGISQMVVWTSIEKHFDPSGPISVQGMGVSTRIS